ADHPHRDLAPVRYEDLRDPHLVAIIRSATLEARPALFPEGLHALPVIVGLDQDRLAEALQGPGRMQIGAHAALDHPLGQAERLRRLGGQARGERARLARELGVLHHTVDEPDPQRLSAAMISPVSTSSLARPNPTSLTRREHPP